MIRRHNRDLINEYGTLEASYSRLFAAGILLEGEKGLAIKGPNWKPPKFMTEKRYI